MAAKFGRASNAFDVIREEAQVGGGGGGGERAGVFYLVDGGLD